MALVTNIPITSATVDNMSRNDYLNWVNECLQSEFSKLEQLHTGAGYSLFTEILFPGSINMKKVKFNSRIELEWLGNWKVVQTAWKQLGIEKLIPVEKLIKGKFQDNFEFLQWFKKFFDANYDGHEYNPLEMRNFEELPKEGKIKPQGNGASLKMPQQMTQKSTARTPPRIGSNISVNSTGTGGNAYKKAAASQNIAPSTYQQKTTKSLSQNLSRNSQVQVQPTANSHQKTNTLTQQGNSNNQSNHGAINVDQQLIEELKNREHQMDELRTQLNESDEVVAGLEKERDFYFSKLRKIEVLCQDNETVGSLGVGSVLQILYETEDGFAPPEEVDGSPTTPPNDEVRLVE